jgi:hypothetical protein
MMVKHGRASIREKHSADSDAALRRLRWWLDAATLHGSLCRCEESRERLLRHFLLVSSNPLPRRVSDFCHRSAIRVGLAPDACGVAAERNGVLASVRSYVVSSRFGLRGLCGAYLICSAVGVRWLCIAASYPPAVTTPSRRRVRRSVGQIRNPKPLEDRLVIRSNPIWRCSPFTVSTL